jgi:hypothetical protein
MRLRRGAIGLLTSAPMSDRSRLSTALLLSMLVHAVLLLTLNQSPLRARDVPDPGEMFNVDLVELPPPRPAPARPVEPPKQVAAAEPPRVAQPESRIVPMPEAGSDMPSDDARFLSDRDNIVEQETVRRGLSPDKAGQDKPGQSEEPDPDDPALDKELAPPLPPPVAEPPAAKPPAPKPAAAPGKKAPPPPPAVAERPPPLRPADSVAKRAVAPGVGAPAASGPRDLSLSDLLPRPGDVAIADRGEEGGATAPETEPGAQQAEERRDLMPRRRVQFSSGSGIATLLPSVRDGDVTLLNTKAHQFAPFVRRVAVRIFQHLQIALLEAARRGAAGVGREVAVVRATMATDGRFLRSELRESHSETRLSVPRLLYGLIGPKTFFDQNPPAGAVSADGDIHFDLTVDLRVWSDGGATRGTPITQFEGVLGVSLLE